MKAANLTLIMANSIYIIIVFCAVFVFGYSVEKKFLDNIAIDGIWVGYILQLFFLILIACHIPYIFFAGKESFLVMLDEIHRNSLSHCFDKRLKLH
jgi:hypothetical protein